MKKIPELKEIRAKDTKALTQELDVLNKKLVELQFKTAFKRLKNFHEITLTRKRIARIWTILNEKAGVSIMAKHQEETK